MVKRPDWRTYGFLAFAIILLLLTWETQKTNAALLDAGIPQDAIRIRIVANSDSIPDQAVKRVIRDRISDEVREWIGSPKDMESARGAIREHLGAIDARVGEMLASRGFSYTHKVEFGLMEFPEKLSGAKLYSSGEYETLLITLGDGKGNNWWCVLFPPLCFADTVAKENPAEKDAAAGSAEAASSKEGDGAALKAENSKEQAGAGAKSAKADKTGKGAKEEAAGSLQGKDSAAKAGSAQESGASAEGKPEGPEVRFFLLDLLDGLIRWVKGLFA